LNDILIEKDWFKVWVRSHYPPTVPEFGIILSVYSPYLLDDNEREKNGEYTSFLTFGVFKDENNKHNIILFSLFEPAILNPAEVITHTRNLCHDYLNNSEIKLYEGNSPDLLITPFEKDMRGTIHQKLAMKNNSVSLHRFRYEQYGKTLDSMLVRIMPRIVEGRVWVAANPMWVSSKSITQAQVDKEKLTADSLFDGLRNVDAKFLTILCSYPVVATRSTMWALVQVLIYLERKGIFSDDYHKDGSIKPKHKFYGIGG
jgi:hypothetical protein